MCRRKCQADRRREKTRIIRGFFNRSPIRSRQSMVEFKVVVSDPKSGRAYNVDASGGAAGAIVGKRIGDEIDAGTLGLAGIINPNHRYLTRRNHREERSEGSRTQKTPPPRGYRVSPDNRRESAGERPSGQARLPESSRSIFRSPPMARKLSMNSSQR